MALGPIPHSRTRLLSWWALSQMHLVGLARCSSFFVVASVARAMMVLGELGALYYATALPPAICVERPQVQRRFRGQARCSSCKFAVFRYAEVLRCHVKIMFVSCAGCVRVAIVCSKAIIGQFNKDSRRAMLMRSLLRSLGDDTARTWPGSDKKDSRVSPMHGR